MVTLLVLIFARDISRASHNATGPRRSEDLSFAALADTLVAQENDVDSGLTQLLTSGSTLDRAVMAADLASFAHQLTQWQQEADLASRPALHPDVNDVLADTTATRVGAYQALLATVARALTLPWPAEASLPTTAALEGDLRASAHQWNQSVTLFATAPGHPSLTTLTSFTAQLGLVSALTTLSNAPSLTLRRGVGIAAVSISPAPLPAPAGTVLLVPTSSLRVAVSVVNGAYANQPVTITVTVTSSTGTSQTATTVAALGPLGAYAYTPAAFSLTPGEHATLRVALTGAPAAPNRTLVRTYAVVDSASVTTTTAAG